MASLGDIVIGLQMDNRQFNQAANSTRGTLASMGTSALGVVGQIGGMLGAGGALASIGWGVKLAADAEQTQIAFEVMLGSVDHAKSLLADLKAYSERSPFDVAGTNQAAQKLLNYGISAEKILPTISMLGDVAAGDMEKFAGLSTAFGQMSATGRLMGGDLNQFINAGFNPLQEIAKETGESMRDLKARMEAGGISAKEVAGAFEAATSEGGRFYGMTERQAGSLAGKWSTFQDSIAGSLRMIGESIVENLDLTNVLDHVTSFVDQIPFLFRNAGSLIEIAVLDWQIYLYEFVPAAEAVMTQVGAGLNATWEGSKAMFDAFVKNLIAGLKEIKNLALATWESIKAGIAAIGSGKNP
ncbi:tape measure protein, partial [Schlesneria paludicola]|uniref:tape measure protein n=1 Tax=Schlesneria paludicola TaxID=360056 RepID=UPI000299D28D